MRTPPEQIRLLLLMSVAMPVAWATWSALLNNFVVERAAFTGAEIGILQSLREVPGFLAFTAVFVLLVLREQSFAILSLAVLGLGVALTGLFPTEYGLYFTAVIMSIGFHYFETVKQSLSLQWLHKDEAPQLLGRMIAAGALTSLIVYALLWVIFEWLAIDYVWVYLLAGGVCMAMAVYMRASFPVFSSCLLYTSPSPRDATLSRMPSSA